MTRCQTLGAQFREDGSRSPMLYLMRKIPSRKARQDVARCGKMCLDVCVCVPNTSLACQCLISCKTLNRVQPPLPSMVTERFNPRHCFEYKNLATSYHASPIILSEIVSIPFIHLS